MCWLASVTRRLNAALALSTTLRFVSSWLTGTLLLRFAGSYQSSCLVSDSITDSNPSISVSLSPVDSILGRSLAVSPLLDLVDWREDARDDCSLLMTDLNSTTSCWVRERERDSSA